MNSRDYAAVLRAARKTAKREVMTVARMRLCHALDAIDYLLSESTDPQRARTRTQCQYAAGECESAALLLRAVMELENTK